MFSLVTMYVECNMIEMYKFVHVFVPHLQLCIILTNCNKSVKHVSYTESLLVIHTKLNHSS